MQTRIKDKKKELKVLIIFLLVGSVLTGVSTFIVKIDAVRNFPELAAKITVPSIGLSQGYFLSSNRYIRITDRKCDNICINEIGFPLSIYEFPHEHGWEEGLSMTNLLLNIAFYSSLGYLLYRSFLKYFRFRWGTGNSGKP